MRKLKLLAFVCLASGICSCTTTKHLEKTSSEETRHVVTDSTVKKTETKQETVTKIDSSETFLEETTETFFSQVKDSATGSLKSLPTKQTTHRKTVTKNRIREQSKAESTKADSSAVHKDDDSKKKTEGKMLDKQTTPFKLPWWGWIFIALGIAAGLWWKLKK